MTVEIEETVRPEMWLPVIDYEGFYEVSNHGRVRRVGGGLLQPSGDGRYQHVSLCRYGNVKSCRIHVVVLTAFCGRKPFEGAHAAHNNGNANNCHLTNLRWATAVENQADVDRHDKRCRGAAIFGAVLTDELVRKIHGRINLGERNRPIADDFGVSTSTIHLIRHRKIWKHVA